jgi:DNA mismatch repair protein MSH5
MPFKEPYAKPKGISQRSKTSSASGHSSSAFDPLPSKRARGQPPRNSQHATPQRRYKSVPVAQHSSTTNPPRSIAAHHQSDRVLEDEDDTIHEIVLALDMRIRETIGASYYVARTGELKLLSDIKAGGLPTVEQLRVYVQPTVVLLPSRIDEKVSDALDPKTNDSLDIATNSDINKSSEPSSHAAHILEIRPSNEFSSEGGKARLADVELPSEDGRVRFVVPGEVDPYESYEQGLEMGFTARQGKMLGLASKIDLDSEVSVGCAGAILMYLKRRRSGVDVHNTRMTRWRISEVGMFELEGTM